MRVVVGRMCLSLSACGGSQQPASSATAKPSAAIEYDALPTLADVRSAYERKIASVQSILGGDMRLNSLELGACSAEADVVTCQAKVDVAVDGKSSEANATLQLRRTPGGFDLFNMPGMDVEQTGAIMIRGQ